MKFGQEETLQNESADLDRIQVAMLLEDKMIVNVRIAVDQVLAEDDNSDFKKWLKIIEVDSEFESNKLRQILEHEKTLNITLKRVKSN